jgi:hypothetical protein
LKKFLILLAMFFIATVYFSNGFVSYTSAYGGDYTFYNKEYGRSLFEKSDITELRTAEPWQAQVERLKITGVKAESVRFQGCEKDITDIISKLKIDVRFKQVLNGVEIWYGYTYRLRGYILIDGVKTNIQLAKRGNTVTAGTPVILGSY